MTPPLCQSKFPYQSPAEGCPAHEAGREPATLVERIEHFYALAPGDRRTGGEAALLQEALKELRAAEARRAGLFGG